MALALGLAWGALVAVMAWRRRPPPRRLRSLVVRGTDGAPALRDRSAAALADLASRILRRPVPPALAGRVGLAVLAGAAWLPLAPPLGLASAVGVLALPVVRARRARRRRDAEVRRSMPEVADLLVVAVGAGLTVHLAVAAVARRATGPVAHDLRRVVAEVGLGRRLADGLAEVPDRVGEAVRPLIAVFVAAERYG